MSHTLKFNHPHFPEDYEFGVHGLGRFKNDGSPVEISEDAERRFIAETGSTIKDAFSSNAHVTIEGSSSLSAAETEALLPPVEESAPPPVLSAVSAPDDKTVDDNGNRDDDDGGDN